MTGADEFPRSKFQFSILCFGRPFRLLVNGRRVGTLYGFRKVGDNRMKSGGSLPLALLHLAIMEADGLLL